MELPKNKVEFVSIERLKKKWYESNAPVDHYETVVKVEKLIAEYDAEGYDMITQTPINDYTVIHGSFAGTLTSGILITFRKRG